MARILLPRGSQWYEELRAVAYYLESDLEKWILQHSRSIFPHHYVFPFKKDIAKANTEIRKRPDLALIRRDFGAWAVIEVEVERHALSHVLEQVEVFRAGDYNTPELAEYAQRQLNAHYEKRTSLKRLGKLFSTQAPTILVIADVADYEWQVELRRKGVGLCIFEIYKNVGGHYVYRTHGEYPYVPAEAAHCRPASLPNLLEVVGDFTFKNWREGKYIEIFYDECLTQWDLIRESGKQYLRSVGSWNPLAPTATYGLFRDGHNRYHFRRS